VAEHHSNARRVGLSAPMAALRLLQRTKAICCEACLTMSADRPTELIKITSMEHYFVIFAHDGQPAKRWTQSEGFFSISGVFPVVQI
jgi:hypothetical protein